MYGRPVRRGELALTTQQTEPTRAPWRATVLTLFPELFPGPLAASLAVNELLARLHPYREEPNHAHASVIFSLASMELMSEADQGICDILGGSVGKGDTVPLLGLMEFAKRPAA